MKRMVRILKGGCKASLFFFDDAAAPVCSREPLSGMIAKRLLVADIFAQRLERLMPTMLGFAPLRPASVRKPARKLCPANKVGS